MTGLHLFIARRTNERPRDGVKGPTSSQRKSVRARARGAYLPKQSTSTPSSLSIIRGLSSAALSSPDPSSSPKRSCGREDDSDTNSSTTLGSPTTTNERTWVSPTKDKELFARASPSFTHLHSNHREIGSDSPTDPSGVHPIELHDVDQVHLHHSFGSNSRALFAESDHGMVKNHQMSASRDANGRKGVAAASKKTNGTAVAATWREQVAHSVRDAIHVRIVEYLKALKPNAPEKVLARVPGLASRMEESLLKLANSQDEYSDLSTLAQRLTSIQQLSAKKLLQQQAASPRVGPATASSNTSSHENGGSVRSTTPLNEDQARFVFQCLQSWRQKLVNMYGVAPWEILPNPILAKVAVYAPSTEQELGVCGVQEDHIARFGSSLLKELQMICGSTASARNASPSSGANHHATTAAAAPAKASRKAESNKRAADPKKRKTNNLAPAGGEPTNGNSRLAPAPNSFMMPHAANPGTMIPPSQLLFRPPGMDALPTLLPSASAGATTSAKKSSFSSSTSTTTRLSPTPLLQQPFFSRLPSPGQQQHDGQENNHMHLLAQGAGHMSKQQQDAKTIDMYEKELQTLRWMLHQSQQEKSQLEGEVQRLRHQLQGTSSGNGSGTRDARQLANIMHDLFTIGSVPTFEQREENMEVLVEGQTLLHGGRYRFLRRIGTGTFAIILRAVDVQRGVAVAIKCMQHEEYNALGKQEADTLQLLSEQDPHAQCAIVRLLGTFVEQKRFCLVLEALGEPILDVARWGSWRQPYQERTLRSPASARRHKLLSVAGRKSGAGATTGGDATAAASPIPICPSFPPLPLEEIRQIAVHLCGALAFLHDQDFIHADLKPENIVRNPTTSSSITQSASTLSTVKLIDLGNCIDRHLLKLYAAQVQQQQDGDAGFDVQTLAYRSPEVAAGLEISTAIDMWSLGCVLLECASGAPLFTTSPAIVLGDFEQNGQETAWREPTENQVILRQIEYLLNDGDALDSACSVYKDASCYHQNRTESSKRGRQQQENTHTKSPQVRRAYPPLSERLEAVAPVSKPDGLHAQFHSFIRDLLSIDPSARMTAREALFHPFLQSFFPFRVLFRSPAAESLSKSYGIARTKRNRTFTTERSPIIKQASEECSSGAVVKEVVKQELPLKKRKKTPKQKVIRFSNGAPDHGKLTPNLRAALKLIPTATLKTER
ncbi:Cmgc protein kinase, partial [Globisporangium splendens]